MVSGKSGFKPSFVWHKSFCREPYEDRAFADVLPSPLFVAPPRFPCYRSLYSARWCPLKDSSPGLPRPSAQKPMSQHHRGLLQAPEVSPQYQSGSVLSSEASIPAPWDPSLSARILIIPVSSLRPPTLEIVAASCSYNLRHSSVSLICIFHSPIPN